MTFKAMYLPDIVAKVDSFLQEKNLKVETRVEELMEYQDPVYKTFGTDQEGKRFFLKAGLVGSGKKLEKLKKEILFWQALDKVDLVPWSEEKKIGLPAHWDSSLAEPFPWLLLERCPAEITGNWFAFREDFLNQDNLITLTYYFPFLQFLYQSLSRAGSFDFSDLPKRDGTWLVNSLERKKDVVVSVFDEKTYDLIVEKLQESKRLLDEECRFLLHRDSHPENILLAEDGRLFLVDFNDNCFGNEAYGFGHLWVHGWKKPDWQKDFLEEYLNQVADKERFLTLFRLSLFDLLTSEIENLRKRCLVGFRILEKEIDLFQTRAIGRHADVLRLVLVDKLI